MRGFTIWLTGLSGAGKSTISARLAAEMAGLGQDVEVLDGDEVRTYLSSGLGFSKDDRDTNIRRIGYVARLLSRHGVAVIVAAISPYRETRDMVREMIGDGFIEVFVATSLEECERRDIKGLYAKARSGEIKEFTGISDPYEPPLNAEIVVETEGRSAEESAAHVIERLEQLGFVRGAEEAVV